MMDQFQFKMIYQKKVTSVEMDNLLVSYFTGRDTPEPKFDSASIVSKLENLDFQYIKSEKYDNH